MGTTRRNGGDFEENETHSFEKEDRAMLIKKLAVEAFIVTFDKSKRMLLNKKRRALMCVVG
jgi:hypothetical protein